VDDRDGLTRASAAAVDMRKPRLATQMAAALALTTLAALLLGGLVIGIVMNDQVIGMKDDLPRFVAEETRTVLGLEMPRLDFVDRLFAVFFDSEIVQDTQSGVEARVVKTAMGPIGLAYLAVVVVSVTLAGLYGRHLGSKLERQRPILSNPNRKRSQAQKAAAAENKQEEIPVSDYLPERYVSFREAFPEVAEALDSLGAAAESAGPLDQQTQRLVKLGIAIGSLAEGSVRSNVRRALEAGATKASIRHVALLAVTTAGYPTAMAGLSWIDEVLDQP